MKNYWIVQEINSHDVRGLYTNERKAMRRKEVIKREEGLECRLIAALLNQRIVQ